jgi:hypothetical protein
MVQSGRIGEQSRLLLPSSFRWIAALQLLGGALRAVLHYCELSPQGTYRAGHFFFMVVNAASL